jgi:hypothetical protein
MRESKGNPADPRRNPPTKKKHSNPKARVALDEVTMVDIAISGRQFTSPGPHNSSYHLILRLQPSALLGIEEGHSVRWSAFPVGRIEPGQRRDFSGSMSGIKGITCGPDALPAGRVGGHCKIWHCCHANRAK